MKVRLLKILRKRTWNKYSIQNWRHVAGCYGEPWHICTGPNEAIGRYATREQAVDAVKYFWHEEARKYLFEHREERKHNKYPW